MTWAASGWPLVVMAGAGVLLLLGIAWFVRSQRQPVRKPMPRPNPQDSSWVDLRARQCKGVPLPMEMVHRADPTTQLTLCCNQPVDAVWERGDRIRFEYPGGRTMLR